MGIKKLSVWKGKDHVWWRQDSIRFVGWGAKGGVLSGVLGILDEVRGLLRVRRERKPCVVKGDAQLWTKYSSQSGGNKALE